ncbi:hypothetical protein DFH06DRAFT_506471 [Mycena polygramma]|nr:hypothetical protein DFH06DRAFT_506471 [Mycena polygramma]
MSSFSASTKIVLVTGANKGLGYETVKQLAQLEGYHVLLGSRNASRGANAAETLQKAGLPVELLTIDVSDDNSIEAAAQTVKAKFGRLDVLIHNAGVVDNPALQSVRENFEQTFAVNIFGAAVATEAFIPLLEKSSAARIVFVSSDLGSMALRAGADPKWQFNFIELPAYRSSKAAMNMLALGYAHRFKAQGWKVNIHNPGYTATDMTNGMGSGTVEDGAKGAVRLATLGDDGETATYSEKEGPLPWWRCFGLVTDYMYDVFDRRWNHSMSISTRVH